jgi:hypothetical protein
MNRLPSTRWSVRAVARDELNQGRHRDMKEIKGNRKILLREKKPR